MRNLNWETYENELTEIVEKYKAKATVKTVGRANGNGISNVYSGEIEIRKGYTIHGGTYSFNRYCPTVITVGSNVDIETATQIATEAKEINTRYLGNAKLTINGDKVSDCSKYGTAFSTYGLGN